MDEPSNTGSPEARRQPPELPRRLLDLWPVATTGIAAWFVAFLVLLVIGWHGVWMYTALCGTLLGLVGLPLMLWQRSASRRGVRSAQRNL